MTEIPPYRPDPLAADFGASSSAGAYADLATGSDAAMGSDATHDLGTSMFGDPFGGLLPAPASAAPDSASDPAPHPAPDRPSAPAAPVAADVPPATRLPDNRAHRDAPGQAPPSASTPGQPRTGTPWPTAATPGQVGSGCRKALLLLALFVIVPIAIAVVSAVLALVDDDGDDGPVSPTPSESQAVGGPVTPVPVPERSVAAPPVGATSVRFEVQGPGRVADVSVYRDGATTRESDQALPWAASVPITPDSSYFNVRATDYGTRDGGPMQCRAYVGDVLVALNTGIERVECTVTSASFPRPSAPD